MRKSQTVSYEKALEHENSEKNRRATHYNEKDIKQNKEFDKNTQNNSGIKQIIHDNQLKQNGDSNNKTLNEENQE